MSLEHRQGTDIGLEKCKKVIFQNQNTALYASGKNLVGSNIHSFHQRFFLGCESEITTFTIIKTENLLITANENSTGKSNLTFWRLIPVQLISVFQTDLSKIFSVSYSNFSLQNENILQLAVVGKDDLRRDVIVIYDITNYFENSFKIFTKQISDFVIRKLSYLDREDPNT
jgi:hypothetical protein